MPKTALTSTFNFTPEASYNYNTAHSTQSSKLRPNNNYTHSTTASSSSRNTTVSTTSNVTTRSSILFSKNLWSKIKLQPF